MRTRLLTVLVAALALLLPAAPAQADGDGNALDRAAYHSSGTYQLQVRNFEGRITQIRDRPGVWGISFGRMISSRGGRLYSCGSGCRDWQSSADNSHEWWPQGLTGSRESRWSGAPSTEILASSWYKKVDGRTVGSAIKFVSTADWTYRHVPLRHAVPTSNGLRIRPLRTHAGGLAWAGPYIYAADTWGMYRFDMRQVLANSNGPFLLPDRYYAGVDKWPYRRARISSVSTDWSSRVPTLVTAEYKKSTDATAAVVRWPLWDGGALRASNGRVSSDYNLWIDKDSTIDKVQGVESHRGVWFFSSGQGYLHRARLETQRHREDWRWGNSYLDSDIPEDLYAVPGHRMYGQTEERTDRRIFWRSMSSVMP